VNHTPEDQKTEPATQAPFRLSCTCGADINAPDRPFTLGPIALVSHANHALIWLRCQTCKADHELALWTIDQQRFISEVGPNAFQPDDPHVAELVERYEQLIEHHRRDIERQYDQQEEWPVLDLSRFDVDIQTDCFVTPPMAVLAAARGLRRAVAARPGVHPPGIVLLGRYKCVLSFDHTPRAPYPYALHLSVGNAAVPGHLPEYQLRWLVSLFFTPGEAPFLLAQPGERVPVVHFNLPVYEPELNPC
jgi:hypothetical protein